MASRPPSVPGVNSGSRFNDLPSRLRGLHITGLPESKRVPLIKDKFLPRFKTSLSNTQKKSSKQVPSPNDSSDLGDENISASNTLYSRLDEAELELSRRRYPSVSKLLSKLKRQSTLDDLPITNNLPFKVFGSTASSFDYLNSDSDATLHSRLPIHASNNAVRTTLPSSIQKVDAAREALDPSRSAPNQPPWPRKFASDLPSFSDSPATLGYQTNTSVSNLSSHNVRPPEPTIDQFLASLPDHSSQQSVTTPEPEGQHRLSLRQFLLAVARQLAEKHGHGDPETDQPNSSKGSRCSSGRSGAKDSTARQPEVKSTGQRGKRRRSGDRGSGNGGGKRSKLDANANPFARFACPFFKKDPIKYFRCAMLNFDTASHMLQHLFRSHYVANRCPRCRTSFETRVLWNAHVGSCDAALQPQPDPYDGLTEDQATELRGRRRERQISERDRWYRVWDIACGGNGIAQPQSPLLDDDVSGFVRACLTSVASASPFAAKLADDGLIASPGSLGVILDRVSSFLSNTLTIHSHESESDTNAPSDNAEAGSLPRTPSMSHQIATATARIEPPGSLHNKEDNTSPFNGHLQNDLLDSGGSSHLDQYTSLTPLNPNVQEPDETDVRFDEIDALFGLDESESSDKGKGRS
ncbi:hypothetical protein CCHR01_04759 [Colletotrichum chrysophilum]|uniref:C2H2-type domain-containing protein n=1 Tax=Colletotrichum chrysophilum TaxID=1836956 RepID=A0AAD9ASF3_9PEZI|nr:hypothetical protein CCHR01_04759 [Colletotrichum chrysophilum]